MSRLALYLFGPPRLELDGEPIQIPRRKAVALLAYLAMTGQPHSRDSLAALFWPKLDQSRARADLRRTLSLLNRTLGEEWLLTDRETAGLNPDAEVWLDVNEFHGLLAACETHAHPPTAACPDCLPLLEEVVALYRDHFLAGFTLRDSAAFDEFQFFQTEGLKDELAGALVRLANYYISQGDFDQAIGYARRWLALDTLNEAAHRHLMVLYAQSGQRAAALRQYEICRQLLAEELGIEPAEKTQETYERLLKGELPVGPTAVEAILERELRTVGECPYRSLAPFREADAAFFFGREAFTERLAEAVRTRSMVAVIVGSSGSGKSSAVFAGLLPQLRQEGNWPFADFRPGAQPFQALAAALLPALESGMSETDQLIETRKLAAALKEGDIPLIDVVERALERSGGTSRLLSLIDQFEELYTLCYEPELRRRFLETLLTAVGAGEGSATSPLVLALTLRADFMGQALVHRPFADALQDASWMLGPMTRDELRTAIEKPAEKQGAAFEAGLVERVLDDVGEAPGNLPLLEFALTLLWERLDHGWMTHAAYEEIGQVEGALARYAEQVFDDLDADAREGVRQVLVQLVQPGEGTKDTRRVTAKAELGEESWGLVQHLADRRLVVTGREPSTGVETVEVVHEALIQGWGRLRGWMEADRAFRTWQERLRVALRGWETSERDEGALLRGAPLAEAEDWLTERGAELSTSERTFIQASVDLRERRAAERGRRRRRIFAGMAAGLVIALSLASVAVWQRQEALVQASIGLASQSQLELEGMHPERAVLLALEALENYPYTWQAERALGQAVLGSRLRAILQHEAGVNSARWSPDGTRILTASDDGTARVWDASSGEALLTLSSHKDAVMSGEWSPAGDRFATSSADGTARVWDAGTGEQLLKLSCWTGCTVAVWSPTAKLIVTGSPGGSERTRTWDATTGEELATLVGGLDPSGPLDKSELWWSPDGSRVASASSLNVIVWDAITGERLFTLTGHRETVDQIAWSPDGSHIVSTSFDNTAKVWDAATGEELLTLVGHTDQVYDVAWSPDGSRIVTGSEDNTARVWDVSTALNTGTSTARELFTLAGHRLNLHLVMWSPDGFHIATFGDDNTGKVWDADTGTEVLGFFAPRFVDAEWSPSGDRLLAVSKDGAVRVWELDSTPLVVSDYKGWFTQAAWSPTGDRVAGGPGDLVGKVWDAITGEELVILPRHPDLVSSVDWSPDGARIATGSADGTVIVSDARTGKQSIIFTGHSGGVFAIRWSPEGTRIVSSNWDTGIAQVWDADTGTLLFTFFEHTGSVSCAEWSPDGRHIVTAGFDDGTAKIWDAPTGQVVRDLYSEKSESSVRSADWSPDGTRIATCGVGGGKIWNATTGEELVTFDCEAFISWSQTGDRILGGDMSGMVTVWDADTGSELVRRDIGSPAWAAWSPDGRRIATTSRDGLLRVFPGWQTTQELIDYARECCVVRELTAEEQELFGLGPR